MSEPKRMGRPSVYGKRRKLLIMLPLDLAERLETWRAARGLSQAAAVAKAVENMVGKAK